MVTGKMYQVRPCVERIDENGKRHIERPTGDEKEQFWGVYFVDEDGTETQIADFINCEDALFFVTMKLEAEKNAEKAAITIKNESGFYLTVLVEKQSLEKAWGIIEHAINLYQADADYDEDYEEYAYDFIEDAISEQLHEADLDHEFVYYGKVM